MDKNFSIEQMKSAFLKVRGTVTEGQMAMLKFHFANRLVSTGKLAQSAGYKGGYRIANIQYGTFCRRLASELGFVSPRHQIYTIATVKGKDKFGHAQWRMDNVVFGALKELGWFS